MNRNLVRGYAPYFYIWGTQWVVQAMLDYLGNMGPRSTGVTASLWAAALLSLLFMGLRLAGGKNRPDRSVRPDAVGDFSHSGHSESNPAFPGKRRKLGFLVPALLLLASIVLIGYVRPVNHLLFDLIRPLGLAFLYGLIGVWMGRTWMYLGVWLFALTAVLSVWFLGFVPLVLTFFGGLSLVACALFVQFLAEARPKPPLG